MKNIIISLFALLLFSGCNVKTLPLDEKWRPLQSVVERGKVPEYAEKYVSNGVVTTIGRHVYVANIEEWEKKFPEESLQRDDLLAHELVHSHRQLKMGLVEWLEKYIKDKKFRLHEEKLGYYVDIRRKVNRGWSVNAEFYAQGMSQYYFGMVKYEDALIWVNDVINGRWAPEKDELPKHPSMPEIK